MEIIVKASDIQSGTIKKVSANGKDIAVCNIDGQYFAVDDTCTHAGASLSEGKLDCSRLVCGWHAAEFDCKTGKLMKLPAKIRDLQKYEIITRDEDLVIKV